MTREMFQIRTRYLKMIPFLVLPLVAFKCGHGFPVIQNMLEQPVALTVQYHNGQSTKFELPPGTQAIAPPEANGVDEIEVRVEGELLFKVGRAELERLRSTLPPEARVMWEIHEEGVMPIDLEVRS